MNIFLLFYLISVHSICTTFEFELKNSYRIRSTRQQFSQATNQPKTFTFINAEYSDPLFRSWSFFDNWFGSLFEKPEQIRSEDEFMSQDDYQSEEDDLLFDQQMTQVSTSATTPTSRSPTIETVFDSIIKKIDETSKNLNEHFDEDDEGYFDHIDTVDVPEKSTELVTSHSTMPKIFSLEDYLDEDRKYFEYYSDTFSDDHNQTIGPSIIKVVNGINCEMLNGERGECQPAEHCVSNQPERRAFSLCEWSVNPVSGTRQPLKLCCPKRTLQQELESFQNNNAGSPVKKFHWGFFGFPTLQNLVHQPQVINQCGKSLYSRDHRRGVRHVQRYVYELKRMVKVSTDQTGSKNSTITYSPRIVSGVSVSSGEVPWTISIYLQDQFVCGGSMITDRHVLTAAHCFASSKIPEYFYIRYGSVVLHEGPAIPVRAIMVHPGYKPPLIYHDIAMMELSYPIRFSSQVQPICLPTSRMYGSNLIGLKSTVSGFGDSNFEGQQSDFLQAVDIKIIENQFCNQNYQRLAESKRKFRYGIGRTLICAGYEQGIKDACQGDSGGPLTIEFSGTHYQIGIVSFGFRCAQPNFPGIYTAVSHYRKWILDNIHHHPHYQKKNASHPHH